MQLRTPILVIGMSAGGAESLHAALRERVYAASVLAGGARHLDYFPAFSGERLLITNSVEPAVARLALAWERGESAVALASGDPLWYGIGAGLRRTLPPEALEIVPAPTTVQMAFAALAEPWHDAALLSAHGRPLETAVAAAGAAPKAAILTDSRNTPSVIAAALISAGLPPTTVCAVCERLGSPEQRIIRTTLAEATTLQCAPLNVFVLWNDSPARPHPPGLPDDAFSTEAGQITKREVRLLSLAELALAPGEILWDIGAGSGAVGIEAARAQPTASVYAVEQRPVFVEHIRANLRRFPAPNLALVEGQAPEACASWPEPHAIFIGGSGGRLADLLTLAQRRLRPEGRLVVNLVTLDHLHTVRALLPEAQITQTQISRGVSITNTLRFEALNPVFIGVWRKERA
jgi:precorrin-6Y C5,15-methyltransferase (decarboxylating)